MGMRMIMIRDGKKLRVQVEVCRDLPDHLHPSACRRNLSLLGMFAAEVVVHEFLLEQRERRVNANQKLKFIPRVSFWDYDGSNNERYRNPHLRQRKAAI